MTKEQYIKITEPLRKNPVRAKQVKNLNHILTGFVFCMYPLYLLKLLTERNTWFIRALLVPAVSFVCLSVIRRIINAPRPYEKFDIPPVLEKDTTGKSFPSRHVYSAFIIAFTFMNVSAVNHIFLYVGIVLALIAMLVAVIRVISGVHFISDVFAAFAFATFIQIISYYL